MSDGIGLTTIAACLKAGEPLMGVSPSEWRSVGGEGQDYLAANYLTIREGLRTFKGDSLRAYAHFERSSVEDKKAEWKMRTPPLPLAPTGAVYMIAQLREMMSWKVKGKLVHDFRWPAFWLKDGVNFYTTPFSNEPVCQIHTQEGDEVYVMRWPHEVKGLDILFLVNKIRESLEASYDEYAGIQIPHVYADMTPDLSWVLGFSNLDWFIAYAAQKILFGMNEIGFAVREETQMVSMRAVISSGMPYILSPNGEPFLFWRERYGVGYPISVFQFTAEDFRDPGDLRAIIA